MDACIEAFDSLLAECRISLGALVTRLGEIDVCSQVWVGQKDPGAACERSAECRPSSDPNTFTSCSDSGRCQRLQIVSDGAACSYTGDDVRLCQPGSYCDVQFVGASSCKPAVALGASQCAPPSCSAGKCDPVQPVVDQLDCTGT